MLFLKFVYSIEYIIISNCKFGFSLLFFIFFVVVCINIETEENRVWNQKAEFQNKKQSKSNKLKQRLKGWSCSPNTSDNLDEP